MSGHQRHPAWWAPLSRDQALAWPQRIPGSDGPGPLIGDIQHLKGFFGMIPKVILGAWSAREINAIIPSMLLQILSVQQLG